MRAGKIIPFAVFVLAVCSIEVPAVESSLDTARIQKDVVTGFSNGGWCYDRYKKEIKPLDAHTKITIADIQGPAVIRHIHSSRMKKPFDISTRDKELFARGIVLEIWFDDADEPAVMCPLADFFGDGCNGNSVYFTSGLIECAPWSYNCYFTMPFKSRAKVILRNDTDANAVNYSYVEWEPLKKWDDTLGYFHATYDRKCFQLTKNSDEMFFQTEGAGQIIGRQYSVVTDEPIFEKFYYVMEGNNEIDIDGKERAIDYLGTEDSFTFSWGFQDLFAGHRAGITFLEKEKGKPNRLSIYRFHDHMPIRFNKSLRWHINWKYETLFTEKPQRAEPWAKALADNGCWVDFATVYYWYQDKSGGYKHKPLASVADRQETLLHSSVKSAGK